MEFNTTSLRVGALDLSEVAEAVTAAAGVVTISSSEYAASMLTGASSEGATMFWPGEPPLVAPPTMLDHARGLEGSTGSLWYRLEWKAYVAWEAELERAELELVDQALLPTLGVGPH